jgi:integrase
MVRLAQPDPFLGQSARALRPEALLQNRHYLILLASALVHSGTPVEALSSIAVLVQPDNVQKALEYLYERAGRRMTVQIELLAGRARKFVTDAGVPAEDVARLRELYARVVSAGPSRRGMTEKNRRLLDHLDDPAFIDRLVTLPFRLMAAARQMTASTPAASSARDAVAIEILLSCSMRVGNLIELRLGESIRRFGEGPRARWAIDIPGEKVKNGQPLRYTLLPESAQLLEGYLEHWHAHWCGPGSPWLFPAANGGHVDRKHLSESIAARAYRYVGVRATAHQYRHLAAELYLRSDPGGIGIVTAHLGHRDLTTTRTYYAREQSRAATERYHEVLIKKRAAVPTPAKEAPQAGGSGMTSSPLSLPSPTGPSSTAGGGRPHERRPASSRTRSPPAAGAPRGGASSSRPTASGWHSSIATRRSTPSATQVSVRPRRACATSWRSCEPVSPR